MGKNPVNWFEIPVNDMERACAFYRLVFGFELPAAEMGPRMMAFFPMTADNFGAGGALVKEKTFVPSHAGTLVYFSVDDIDGTLEKATAAGGKTLVPRTSIGEHGFVGYFEDSEGNRIGLHTMK